MCRLSRYYTLSSRHPKHAAAVGYFELALAFRPHLTLIDSSSCFSAPLTAHTRSSYTLKFYSFLPRTNFQPLAAFQTSPWPLCPSSYAGICKDSDRSQEW